MPLIYQDDAHPDPTISTIIRLHASAMAVAHLDIPAHIYGDPPTYVPTDPSPATMVNYLNLFYYYQTQLAQDLEDLSSQ